MGRLRRCKRNDIPFYGPQLEAIVDRISLQVVANKTVDVSKDLAIGPHTLLDFKLLLNKLSCFPLSEGGNILQAGLGPTGCPT